MYNFADDKEAWSFDNAQAAHKHMLKLFKAIKNPYDNKITALTLKSDRHIEWDKPIEK